jgi:hypothetical protein
MAEEDMKIEEKKYAGDSATPELRDILIINQTIINNLITQKGRLDTSFDKFKKLIEAEASRPANRFCEWTKTFVPYQESVMNAKVTDYELIKAFQNFTKQLIAHDRRYVIRKDEIDRKDEVIRELMNKTVVGLEYEIARLNNLLKERPPSNQNRPPSGKQVIANAIEDDVNKIMNDPNLSQDEKLARAKIYAKKKREEFKRAVKK